MQILVSFVGDFLNSAWPFGHGEQQMCYLSSQEIYVEHK